MNKAFLDISPEVSQALADSQPVVALESTIIAHGMPYPKNISTALEVESEIRKKGAVPATIAILEGKLKVGLSKEEMEFLGKSDTVSKVSRRDIPYVVATKGNGATTVASTMIVAAMAGIKVFVTGGLGGVHRGVEKTMDISADLQELANTNVAVVCAGVKSILDIGLTLEYLETYGVPVLGYQTNDFPAFYTRKSGFGVDYRIDSALELAQVINAKWDLDLKGGVVIGNPVPEKYQMEKEAIDKVIEQALIKCEQLKIKGKEITPFLLSEIKEVTEGKSLETNIQLVLNNARVGAELAVEMSKL